MPLSGGYYYPGQVGAAAPPLGSGIPYVGRGPVEAYIIGGVTLSASLSASDGTTNIELVSLSSSIFNTTSSFSGANYHTCLGPIDVKLWTNLSLTLVNNNGTNKLESGSVEFSPDNNAWETDWDKTTFVGLTAAGGVRSMQITGNSRRWMRVRVIPSGATGALTGSIDAYLHVNNG